ncbi:hypothetical protein BZG36_02464, partial [Bifiguratus adelaidae]
MANKLKIGQYNVLQTLGVGSFGKVKLAVHSVTGHKVALKIINRKKIANLDMAGRVKREIQYLKLLRHPHIIKLYEVITTPTDIIMVIEYAGGELFNYIVERGRMSEDQARRFFQQIICAVEYCHRHKIVHRDLKPENLLLDPFNNVKIADFGLSNIMTDGDFLKTSCGSPNYAAPEVISGKLYAGPEVDVWSCGVILYVMLCGRLPFDDEYIPTLFKKINNGIYSLPNFLSDETKYLLSSMLVVDPLKRITIQEIRRQNPWFNVGLPDYLGPLPDTNDDPFSVVDEGIVEELHKKMGFSTATVRRALEERDNNQIKVAYQLVVDHKRMLNGTKESTSKNNMQSFFATSPPAWNAIHIDQQPKDKTDKDSGFTTQERSEDMPSSSIGVLSTSLPGKDYLHSNLIGQPINTNKNSPPPGAMLPTSLSRHSSMTTKPPVPSNLAPKRKSRIKWHFGIRSRCPPWEVMLELYRALRNVGMEWKTLDTYHVRCRFVHPNGMVSKVDLQLYQLDAHNYLVDFKFVGTTHVHSHFAGMGINVCPGPVPVPVPGRQGTPMDMVQEKVEGEEETRLDRQEERERINLSGIGPTLLRQPVGDAVLSMMPFFDVCSRNIEDSTVKGAGLAVSGGTGELVPVFTGWFASQIQLMVHLPSIRSIPLTLAVIRNAALAVENLNVGDFRDLAGSDVPCYILIVGAFHNLFARAW